MAKEGRVKSKKKLGMQTCFILCSLVPLICGMIILSVISYNKMKSEMTILMEEKLSATCSLLERYYGCDYTEWCDTLGLSLYGTDEEWKNVPNYLPSDTEMIDSVVDEGIEMTVFKGNKRFLSSLRTESGERVYGTEADPQIYANVMKGNTHIASNVVINGKEYMVCYKPLRNIDGKGEVVGMVFAGILEEDFVTACRTLLLVILSVLIVCIAIFAVIAIFIARKVSEPLNKVVEVTKELSEGDLNSDTNIESFLKETTVLIDSVKLLQANLYEIVSNIRTTSGTLSTNVNETNGLCNSSDDGAKQITGAVDELARATQSMAENVQNLAMNMGDIATSVDEINQATEELKSTTSVIEKVSNEAKKDIVSVAESAHTSVEAVNNINEHMTELSNALDEINQATELIANISSQTALLSLNASIEAARAGDAGRGFAVVAEEIQNLSYNSSKSSQKIEQAIIQSRIAVEKGKGLVTKTQETISESIDYSISNAEHVHKIFDSVNDQKGYVDSIAKDFTSISTVVESNAASAEENSAISIQLGECAKQLSDKVNEFKLK